MAGSRREAARGEVIARATWKRDERICVRVQRGPDAKRCAAQRLELNVVAI